MQGGQEPQNLQRYDEDLFLSVSGAKPPKRAKQEGQAKDEADHFCNGKCRKNEGNSGDSGRNRMECAVIKGRGHRHGNRRKRHNL